MGKSTYNAPIGLLDRMILSQELRKARQSAGLSQEQLAPLVGTYQSNLSDYERGRRDMSLSMVQRICKVLGIEASEVVRRASSDISAEEQKILMHYARSQYDHKALGKAVKQMRKEAGVRQASFGSAARVSSWEQGVIHHPEPSAIKRMCDLCGWKIDALLLRARVLEQTALHPKP